MLLRHINLNAGYVNKVVSNQLQKSKYRILSEMFYLFIYNNDKNYPMAKWGANICHLFL